MRFLPPRRSAGAARALATIQAVRARRTSAILSVVALAACSHAPPVVTASPAEHARVVALISANAEWKIIAAQFAGDTLHDTPYGQWLRHRIGGEDVVFFHGGYGKVAAEIGRASCRERV